MNRHSPVSKACRAGLLLVIAGCSVMPPSPQDDAAAVAPVPAETPAAAPLLPPSPAAATPESAVSTPPVMVQAPVAAPVPATPPAVVAVPKGEVPKSVKPPAQTPAKPAAPTTPPATKPQSAAPPSLALAALEQRLKDTPAIGVLTKITLKNQVDELLERFRAHYEGRGGTTLAQLRQSYDQLLLKVLGLLKDGDPALATAITNSREAIWNVLTDPVKFAKL